MSSLCFPAREMTGFRDSGTRRKPCVLLADDDDDLRELMALLLAEAGFLVHTASNGEEALERLALLGADLPDAIVLDLMMPVKTGWEVLEALRADKALAAIPVLVISAAHDLSRAKGLGAARVIRKPLEVERLADAVVSCLVPRDPARVALG